MNSPIPVENLTRCESVLTLRGELEWGWHRWAPSPGQDRQQPQPREGSASNSGCWRATRGEWCIGFGILLQGKIRSEALT